MFTPGMFGWRAQFERMERMFLKVSKPYFSSTEYLDDVQHFFQDCWHLKDWIKHDPTLSNAIAIEADVHASVPLQIAADLATAAKHYDRTFHRQGAYATSQGVVIHLGQNRPADIDLRITLGDGTDFPAPEVVRNAFEAWKQILSKHGLL